MVNQDSDFDFNKFKLGSFCLRNHDWRGTRQSVRFIATNVCRTCNSERHKKPASKRRPYRTSPIEYLMARVTEPTKSNCWLWAGAVSDKSRAGNRRYGAWRCAALKEKFAHRAAYRIFKGDIPIGFCVMHSCDAPLCCNPAHLKIGTFAENNSDKIAKGRDADRTGSKHPRASINENTARLIKQRLRELVGEYGSAARIARELKVSKYIVRHILYNKSWSHVA